MIYSKIIFITLFVFLTACGGGSTGGGNVPIVDERPTIPSSVDETLDDINTLLDDLGL
tara:strand:+ start:51 stop:224 length:174 start_codon:yes stop_codon:yes gene_type:complete